MLISVCSKEWLHRYIYIYIYIQNGITENSDDVCALHRLLSMPLSPVVALQRHKSCKIIMQINCIIFNNIYIYIYIYNIITE